LKNAPKLPLRGAFATISVMTWSRGSIFYLSELGEILIFFLITELTDEIGTEMMKKNTDVSDIVASTLPPLVISTIVQAINTPFMNACIDLQVPFLPSFPPLDLSPTAEPLHASAHRDGLFQ
jgi:hypothetical protein